MAATLAGTLSGLPSTVFAAATGHSILEAVRAAGTLIPGRRHRPGVIAGCAAHGLITLFWTGWIAAAARRRPLAARDGAAAGLAIAVLDLGIIGRRYPAIRALPAIPQYQIGRAHV